MLNPPLGFVAFRGFPLVTTGFASRRCLPLMLLQRSVSHVDGLRHARRAFRLPPPRHEVPNDHVSSMTCEAFTLARYMPRRPAPSTHRTGSRSARVRRVCTHRTSSSSRPRRSCCQDCLSRSAPLARTTLQTRPWPQSHAPVSDQSSRSQLATRGRALVSCVSACICMQCVLATKTVALPLIDCALPVQAQAVSQLVAVATRGLALVR